MNKIVVVGNIAGGKTRLSRRLAERYDLPLTHVDTLQFLPGMQIRPLPETRKALLEVASQARWLIDGYGPLDLIEKRFAVADAIVFVDFPLARHLWWCTKRQIQSLWKRRDELPEGCNEATWAHTVKLYKTMWRMHKQMRPELVRIFGRDHNKNKVYWIQNMDQWDLAFQEGLENQSKFEKLSKT